MDDLVVGPAAVTGSGCKHCFVAHSQASSPAAVAAFVAAVDAAIAAVAVTAAAATAVDSAVGRIGCRAAVVGAGGQLVAVAANAESAVVAYSGCYIESAAVAEVGCHTGCYQAAVDYSRSTAVNFDYSLVAVGYLCYLHCLNSSVAAAVASAAVGGL